MKRLHGIKESCPYLSILLKCSHLVRKTQREEEEQGNRTWAPGSSLSCKRPNGLEQGQGGAGYPLFQPWLLTGVSLLL